MGNRSHAAIWILLAIAPDAAAARIPVILISVDTLRADHLSCYGSRGRPTPHIDAIAKGGTLFGSVDAQAPLTLPSHVSLLTSTYPFSNGVEDNGQELPPNVVTLASILKSHGYRTAAFIGGFVLDRRFGLNKGFDFYDSPFSPPRDRQTDPGDLKRLGEDVLRSAMQWIEQNSAAPFFVFLHLFDLHTPDNLPSAVRARFPGPRYQAELAYVDELIGQFWDVLAKRGLLERALIVFLSDHGESLGDHGENTHGFFIYQSTLAVPLIIHWPAGARRFPARVDEPASLMGVAPSILQYLRIPVPPSFQRRSLPRLWADNPAAEEIYSETLYPHKHFHTSALWSLRINNYKYIHAPKPEFYDLSKDPSEAHNLYPAQQAIALGYRKRLLALRLRYRSRPPAAKPSSPEIIARLRSLGYLAGSSISSASPESGPDPKNRIAAYENYRRAIALASAGRLAESNAVLEKLLTEHPGLLEVRGMLGMNQQRLGQYTQAVDAYRQIVQKDPMNALAHLNLAMSYSKLNQLEAAEKELEAALAIALSSNALQHVAIPAEEMLATLWLQKQEYEKARAQFTHLLKIAPDDYEAHYNLAWLAARDGHTDDAFRHLQAAVEADPKSALAHNALGSLYLQRNELDRAAAEFGTAVRLDPKLAFAHYNLGLVLGRKGDRNAAARKFRDALEADPQLHAAREALNRLGKN